MFWRVRVPAEVANSQADNRNNPGPAINPIAVVVRRSGGTECRHRAAFAVTDAQGCLVLAKGDVHAAVFPRSAVKLLQAIPLIETGAAARFGLGDAEIALACASHGGEPCHTAVVESWLDRLGLTVEDLECGSHWPSHEDSARELARQGREPSAIHNNCSGKHCCFLTLARHLGEPARGYIAPSHPVQQRVGKTLATMCEVNLDACLLAIDGCGIPAWALPLSAIATGMARFADPTRLPPSRRDAVKRIAAAIAAQPHMLAGSGRICTFLAETAGDRVIAKVGAEGVFSAALIGRGLGLALKIDDGSVRAARIALVALLQELGICRTTEVPGLADITGNPLRNRAGTPVGEIAAEPGWVAANGEISADDHGR